MTRHNVVMYLTERVKLLLGSLELLRHTLLKVMSRFCYDRQSTPKLHRTCIASWYWYSATEMDGTILAGVADAHRSLDRSGNIFSRPFGTARGKALRGPSLPAFVCVCVPGFERNVSNAHAPLFDRT